MQIRAAHAEEFAAIHALLELAGLPTGDLTTSNIEWLVALNEGKLRGVVGLEAFGSAGLLRSLAVQPSARGCGIASALVAELELRSRERGVRQLLLLTQTAEKFFRDRGYTLADRAAAPADVRDSAEFCSLCPASTVCMTKQPEAAKRVLFVCVENSNRSQMAEAFAHLHGMGKVFAASAGSKPSGTINPKAMRFMGELGYDMCEHRSKSLDEIRGDFDVVVGMGCGDSCPWIPAKRRVDWDLPDPKSMTDDAYREVRDEISRRVAQLLQSL